MLYEIYFQRCQVIWELTRVTVKCIKTAKKPAKLPGAQPKPWEIENFTSNRKIAVRPPEKTFFSLAVTCEFLQFWSVSGKKKSSGRGKQNDLMPEIATEERRWGGKAGVSGAFYTDILLWVFHGVACAVLYSVHHYVFCLVLLTSYYSLRVFSYVSLIIIYFPVSAFGVGVGALLGF